MARVRETLVSYADPKGWGVSARIKQLDSLSEKIESGRFKTWSDLDDMVAATLVIPTMLHEREALSFLQRVFTQVRLQARGASLKAPDVFRFDSTRFIGLLSRPENIDANELAYSIPFEIQIRTAFEHAWSIATHSLTYKNDNVSWERLRLAAHMKSTVEQLDMMILGFEQTSSLIPRSDWPEIAAKSTLTDFFKSLFEGRVLPEELRPKDWSRFADNFYSMLKSSSNLKGKKADELANIAMEKMEPVLRGEGDSLPRSVSLIQFLFASLWTRGIIRSPLSKYVPLITNELEDLFPALRKCTERFDLGRGPAN